MINADEIVQDHNDIIDTQIGRLIWEKHFLFHLLNDSEPQLVGNPVWKPNSMCSLKST